MEWVWLSRGCVDLRIQEIKLVGGIVQWPLLNVCAVSPCWFYVLIVGWVEGFLRNCVPEALRG